VSKTNHVSHKFNKGRLI